MLRLASATLKIIFVSLITGAGLSALDVTAADILMEMGLTPENVLALLERGVSWAVPNIVLGSMVIVPVWLVIYLLKPPRG
ncbi:DUF6460 domain-containing protein [Aquibium oceanicum]|uniref:DUF6460 domain-containing protein n=1 Tax=Aquibium oceanicum TaxID=1670800 RepID=A0A1L3SV43_9HYPH|nr:DUF6460 domain-containing protein [Aquibium oceanicum]APH73296.1 hypothetical protein BSQ44_19405 [Aquibium oceanicum]